MPAKQMKIDVTGSISEELLSICKENLPSYMVPEEFVYLKDLPRTPRGKIDYRVLETYKINNN